MLYTVHAPGDNENMTNFDDEAPNTNGINHQTVYRGVCNSIPGDLCLFVLIITSKPKKRWNAPPVGIHKSSSVVLLCPHPLSAAFPDDVAIVQTSGLIGAQLTRRCKPEMARRQNAIRLVIGGLYYPNPTFIPQTRRSTLVSAACAALGFGFMVIYSSVDPTGWVCIFMWVVGHSCITSNDMQCGNCGSGGGVLFSPNIRWPTTMSMRKRWPETIWGCSWWWLWWEVSLWWWEWTKDCFWILQDRLSVQIKLRFHTLEFMGIGIIEILPGRLVGEMHFIWGMWSLSFLFKSSA